MSNLILNRHNPFLCGPTKAANGTVLTSNEAVEHFIRESLSENTRQAYRFDLAHFMAWGGELPTTPEMTARYLAEHAETLSPATLARRVATLSKAHSANNWKNPCRTEVVRATLRGIKRVKGTAQDQAKPLLREDLFLTLDALGDSVRAKRDRALFLIGWAGGFRSSELTGLNISDIEDVREGLILHLRRSKTDQMRQGRKIGISLGRTRHCPVAALAAWRDALSAEAGSIFRPVDRHGHAQPNRLRADAVSTILRNRLAKTGISLPHRLDHSGRQGVLSPVARPRCADRLFSKYTRQGTFGGLPA